MINHTLRRKNSRRVQTRSNKQIQSIQLEKQTTLINGNPYRFIRELGHGAFGRVYLAKILPENYRVAVKVVSSDARKSALVNHKLSQSIHHEIKMHKLLSQPSKYIVQIFDFQLNNPQGKSFTVMELGQIDLEKMLLSRPPLDSLEVKTIWRQMAQIASYLHYQNIVHSDIKPHNLIIFPGNIIKLTDLGIAKRANTLRKEPNGTAFYSAPEVYYGPGYFDPISTTKSDSWSWAAVLFRMVYDQPPRYRNPCFKSPPGYEPLYDGDLLNLFAHTLVLDPKHRVRPNWLSHHRYTKY